MSEDRIQFHGKPGTIPQDLCRAKNITAEAKTIFALLTTYKEAYPGQAWLADHVPCSGPTVRSRLRELELHGWLLRIRRNRRAKETDIYHVYLSSPLPVEERAEWIQDLGLSDKDIQSLPKGDYGNDITVIPLRKRGFPKRLEGSEVRSVSEVETSQKNQLPLSDPDGSSVSPEGDNRPDSTEPTSEPKTSVTEKAKPEADLQTIAEVWNSKQCLPSHRLATVKAALPSFKARLAGGFTVDQIQTAIENLATAIDDPACWWTNAYTLKEFLSREEGAVLEKFLNGVAQFRRGAQEAPKSQQIARGHGAEGYSQLIQGPNPFPEEPVE